MTRREERRADLEKKTGSEEILLQGRSDRVSLNDEGIDWGGTDGFLLKEMYFVNSSVLADSGLASGSMPLQFDRREGETDGCDAGMCVGITVH